MRISILFSIATCLVYGIACTQHIATPSTAAGSTDICTDSVTIFQQTVIPGAQQTDLDGNIIENRKIVYRIYLFSDVEKISVDSIKNGSKMLTDVRTGLVRQKPLYWNSNDRILMVDKTDCYVQEIICHYNYSGPSEPAGPVTVFYRKNGEIKSITGKTVRELPQMVTE